MPPEKGNSQAESSENLLTSGRKSKTRSKSLYAWLLVLGTSIVSVVMVWMSGYDRKLLQYLRINQWLAFNTTYSLDGFNSEALNQSQYVVYNPRCQILNYPPFHEDVKLFYKKEAPQQCSKLPPLVSIGRPKTYTEKYSLHLHTEYFSLYQNESLAEPYCCFTTFISASEIIAENRTDWFSRCTEFVDSNVTLEPSAEVVGVKCTLETKVVYANWHFLLANKTIVRDKLTRRNRKEDGELSVMLVGMDSVSRLNMLRTMPLTNRYLEGNSWFSFRGYHKIFGNTLHNLDGPILTGHSGWTLMKLCLPDDASAPLEKCPWIWQNLTKRDYVTAIGEDGPREDSFARHGTGSDTLTDYFTRSFMLAAQLFFNNESIYPVCLGPTSSADHILEMSLDFATRFLNQPTFSLFWMNTFSHSFLNGPSMMDQKFVKYFENLKERGILDQTVVVFLSDHGLRGQNLFRIDTHMGYLEDSLPFLFLWLPGWFREKYPLKVQNLKRNKNMLTSHYDLHMTLLDVLGQKKNAAGCPECVSLLDRIPWNRSCAEAGIAKDACACTRYKAIPFDHPLVSKMAAVAVNYINNQSVAYSTYLRNGTRCSRFVLEKVKTARKQVFSSNGDDWNSNEYTAILQSIHNAMHDVLGYHGRHRYIIHFEVRPGGALFEASLAMNDKIVLESMTRLDTYSNKTDCMLNNSGKLYCNCELVSN